MASKIINELINNNPMSNSQFIQTKGALSRVEKVINGIKSGIPLLLEGETGTSKTATARQAAKSINQHAIVFNFSSQTTVEDLLGRMSKNNDSWSGFSFIKGPFTEAFEKGYCLILDEINLAHETVLQCIESSLDSKILSLDYTGSEIDKTIKMHEDFHLIATKNPLTNRFSQKRNFLSHNFISRFHLIKFDEITKEELTEIAIGLSKGITAITPTFILSLINFHFEWQNNQFSLSSISNIKTNRQSFSYSFTYTIREICRTIKSIEKELTPFESIIINYGARYNDESKQEMKKLLASLGINEEYRFFNNCSYLDEIKRKYSNEKDIINTPKNSKFLLTNILEKIFATSFHLLDNSQAILLVGPDGCGKTSISRWIADFYSSLISKQSVKKSDNTYKFFICNPEMTIGDVIGRYVPCKQSMDLKEDLINNTPIEWKNGPVVEAIKNGDCLIFDQIDTAPSTILERLNSLFDGLGEENFKFPIQENLENSEALVDPNFRIIAISSLSGLNNLSPAFLNRFTVIYVNEQLDYNHDQLDKWIKCISPYSNSILGRSHINFLTREIQSKFRNNNKLTSLNVSNCIKGYFKLRNIFPASSESDKLDIFKFCSDVCIDHISKIPEINENFINAMLQNLDEKREKSDQFDSFHFKEAKSTRKVMATLVACCEIGIHTILIGRTGLGKTAAAMAFSRMNKSSLKNSSPHIISFNGETQLDELYGYFTIEKGNFSIHQGDLSQAMSEGQVFIADEMNLADQQIIQSLNVAIEPSRGENIILPVTGTSLTINEGFFFIGCQNDLTMNGRRPIPESIKRKILCIEYPEPTKEDLITLCSSIANQFSLDNQIAVCTATLVEAIRRDLTIKSWSLREVRIIYKRIAYFQTKATEFVGFTPIHHFAFMLISPFKGQIDMIERIATIVCQSFGQTDYIDTLIEIMKKGVIVQRYINGNPVNQHYIDQMDKTHTNDEYSVKLIKGPLNLLIFNSQLFFINENIVQLWETIFEIYLTNQSEPLLFIGPSGFKTYLAGLISSLAPVIYLHSDSTVSSLIGQITLLDRHQAKLSLLDSLFDFTGYEMSLKEPLYKLRTNLEETNEIDIDSLRVPVENIIKSIPDSFGPIVKRVVDNLIELQNEEKDQSNNQVFSNYICLFKPGLITKSIFSQNSLVLKNFAQPSPSVIERFNELLSVTPTLTLFEDTSNTFTTPENNKLYGFSDVFRIIGICKSFEKRNLSDAMLSRLTEIHVQEYSSAEQESIFKTYIDYEYDKDIPISILSNALKIFDKYRINVSFRQKIKIIQVANLWSKAFSKIDIKVIYIISILRCAGGPLPFEMKKKLYDLIVKTFTSIELPSNFSKAYSTNCRDKPFTNKNGQFIHTCLSLNESGDTITSLLSDFYYPNLAKIDILSKYNRDIKFTNSINDLIDIIFSFSIINYPVILEGPNGCGKSSAFLYVAEYLGVKVIQISLSRSTTVEDLFGRFEPKSDSKDIQFEFKPTAFLNAIDKNRNSGEKYWILIEELDLASPSVLDSLEPIFNPQSDHITLPDGSFVQRGNFFVVGLLSNPLQKQSITNAALYYKVRNYTKSEFYEICNFILQTNHLSYSTRDLCPLLAHLYDISSSSQIKVPVTPREVLKLVKMMKSASNHSNGKRKLSYFEISKFLFLGRFYEDDLKEGARLSVNEALKRNVFPENEEFIEFQSLNGGQTISSNTISIKTSDSQSRHDELNYLTNSQKQLFTFLILNIEEYMPIVIQGPTASGKTFGIQLFANAVGQNLRVIQLNSEISSAYIADSYHPTNELTSTDINELQKALEILASFSSLFPAELQTKIENGNINEWKPSEFFDLKKNVEKLLVSEKLDEDDESKAHEFLTKVNSTLLFFSHLERKDSIIIKALTEGDWLLLDGIESAPSDFLDRLSTLLDDPPVLNLYERGSDYVYSTNPEESPKSKRIHPNFRLFMTYNPIGTFSNSVSPSFLSRCSLFSMDPIDSDIFNSSILVFSIIRRSNSILKMKPSEISIKISNVHRKMKVILKKQLTCRTLIHISREIIYKQNTIKNKNQLIEIIFSHYFDQQSANISLNDVEKSFNENADNNLLNYLKEIEKKSITIYDEILKIINNFYSQIKSNNTELILKYDDFISKLCKLQFRCIGNIIKEINRIRDYISENINRFQKKQLTNLAAFNIIYDLLTEIQYVLRKNRQIQSLCIDSKEIQSSPLFASVIFKCQLLSYLYSNNLYIGQVPEIYIDSKFAKQYLDRPDSLTKNRFSVILKSPINFGIPYKWNSGINPIQQICSCIFQYKSQSLFKGLLKDLFIQTYSIFEKNNIDSLIDWIKWLSQFFDCFTNENIVNDFTIPLKDFINRLNNLKNNKDPDFLMNLMNKLDELKKIQKDIEPQLEAVKNPSTNDLFITISNLNLKDTYLEIIDNKEAASIFIKIKDEIEKLQNNSKYNKQLYYFSTYVNNVGQNLNKENAKFLEVVLNSIKKTENLNQTERKISWPSNQSIGQDDNQNIKLFDFLISYSKELEILNTLDLNLPKWSSLCELSNPDILMKEYLSQHKISENTLLYYRAIINGQLLHDIFKNHEENDYCSHKLIVNFLNSIQNRNIKFDSGWLIIANNFSKKYSFDFYLSIPTFSAMDILSFLVNPLTREKGPMLNNIKVEEQLINEFYRLFYNIMDNQDFDYLNKQIFQIVVNYIRNRYPDQIQYEEYEDDYENLLNIILEDDSFTDIHDLCQSFINTINLSKLQRTNKTKANLDFSDILNIDYDKFDEYVNINPHIGFYIAQFPEIIDNQIRLLSELCTKSNIMNDRFPLTLFVFRMLSRINCIQIQLPSDFPSDYAEEFQTLIFRSVSSFKNLRFVSFSNFLGFLLAKIPKFIKTTCYSEYLRNVIINLITIPKESMLINEIKILLKKYIPRILETLGSLEWKDSIINKELKYEDEDNDNKFIINFLANPWLFFLNKINKSIQVDFEEKSFQVISAIETISKMIQNIASKAAISKLKECVTKDESNLQKKLKDNYTSQNKKSRYKNEYVKVFFGPYKFEELEAKLADLYTKYSRIDFDNIKDKIEFLNEMQSDILELDQYSKITFSIENEKPHDTEEYLSNNLVSLVGSAKNKLVISNFEFFNEDYIKKYNFFTGNKNEFQTLLKKAKKFTIQPKPTAIAAKEKEMSKIEASDILLSPSIFRNGDEIKVTIKEIHISNLLFGVDITPLQIRLFNFSREEIQCTFMQKDSELPKPTYRNESGFLVIEIPVELICKNATKYKDNDEKSTKSNIDIEHSFVFEGQILLNFIENPASSVQIKYSITLDYISMTAFIMMDGKHNFAIKNGKADIVPFLSGPNTELKFEKFINRPFKTSFLLDGIFELNDNKALKPNFQSLILKKNDDDRICNIKSSFAESKIENSYLSMNYEFGFSKETKIPVGIHINTLSLNNKLFLAIFSDPNKDFVEDGAIINIGNIPRKIFFFIGCLNISNDPIEPLITEIESNSYYIHTKFEKEENTAKIDPNKFGFVLYYFESSYFGPYDPNKDNFKGSLTVQSAGFTKKIEFIYRINQMEFSKKKFSPKNVQNAYYYDNKSESYNKFDVKKLPQDIWKLPYQLIVSDNGYCFRNDIEKLPKVEYKYEKFKELIYTNEKFEVLELMDKRVSSHAVESVDKLSLKNDAVYLFGRIKDQPETFFPLFVPKQINEIFDSRKLKYNEVEKRFKSFYYQLLSDNDKNYYKDSSLEFIFKSNVDNNYSFIINRLGRKIKDFAFKECIPTIIKFTNCEYFKDHFEQSLEIFGSMSDKKMRFFSFISALNEVVYSRYAQLKTCGFCLKMPISFDEIRDQQQKIFNELYGDEDELDTCQYISNFSEITKEDNNFEQVSQKNYLNNGYKITNVLKWTEINGLLPSNNEEYSKYKKTKYEINSDIKSITDSISNSNISTIDRIDFPKIMTIKTIHEIFDRILDSTYILTFVIYSLKQNNQPLDQIRLALNDLIKVFEWQKECSTCFPFSTFISNFKPAFTSMMTRLNKAKLKINKFELNSSDIKDFDNFVQIPSLPEVSFSYSKFTQPGNSIAVSESKTKSVKIQQEISKSEKDSKKQEAKLIEKNEKSLKEKKKLTKEIIFYGTKETTVEIHAIQTIKKIDFKGITSNTDEIPDNDFIQFLIQEMIKSDNNPNDRIQYRSNKKDTPASILNLNTSGTHNKRIDSFYEASKRMSDVLINEVNKEINKENFQNNLLLTKDSIYASILVDCSSTFSASQKAAIVTLAIALGNALTAIRIPYSIIIFCEDNFQFILKNVDEKHDLIHFEKLIDSIMIRRRMSDMGSAILMADDKIKYKLKDKKRRNHSIFVLTDGLTPKIKLFDQWRNSILNNGKKSVMFYFLDILSNKKDTDRVYPIWQSFKQNIRFPNSKSPNSVYSSSISSIYNGDPNIAKSFIEILTCFPLSEYSVDKDNIEPLFADQINDASKDKSNSKALFENIIEEMRKGIVDETKFYAQCSFPQEVLEQFSEIEFNLVQPALLESFSASLGDIDQGVVTEFLQNLISLSNQLVDSSLYQEISTLVFPFNKPSQYSPSENGSIFYFPGLIKFILTQGQDSKIFLEKKSGLIRSHSVFLVIDNSFSCFNMETFTHAFQTIFSLLYPLSKIDIPSLNIIITSTENPIILCSEKPTMSALDDNSPLWVSLFYHLSRPHSVSSCLYKALMSAYQIKVQQKTESSVLFVLTDGFYNYIDRNEFNGIFNAFKAMNTIPITIGIGLNPFFINLMTDKAIWSQNPRNVWLSILFLYGKEVNKLDTIKTSYTISNFSQQILNNLEEFIKSCKPYFQDLYDELNRQLRYATTYRNYYNEDKNNLLSLKKKKSTNKIDKKGSNPQFSTTGTKNIVDNSDANGSQYDLGKKDYYKGVKLLIVMCWDFTCSKQENKSISEEVLRNGINGNNISVVNALKYFGIETTIVKNYIDAINNIKSGIYSQVWIICGRLDGTMPDNTDPSTNSSRYIDQFIDCLILYWHKGGGLVFWADNYPLTAEVNKFLEKAQFNVPKRMNQPGYDKIKVNFHISGNYPGRQMMERQQSISLNSDMCKFEDSPVSNSIGYQKELFNHELYEIFEGISVSSAVKGNETFDEWRNYNNMNFQFANNNDILPFAPFSKSSSGGFSSLYYMSPLDVDDGDIVIDCGFSKLFFELTEVGIARYVKNIAVWMLQLEKKDIKYGAKEDARLVKPPAFNFEVNNSVAPITCHQFIEKEGSEVDIVFLIDATKSMRFFVDAVRDCCTEIANQCHESFPGKTFRFGAVAYRDTIVSTLKKQHNPEHSKPIEEVEVCSLDENPEEIHLFFSKLKTTGGGGDGPEDWVSGYDCLLHTIKWKPNAIKIVIHICDAEGHGTSFTAYPNYEKLFYKIPRFNYSYTLKQNKAIYDEIQNDQDEQFKSLVKEAAERGLIFFCLNDHKKATYCFNQTRNLYLQYGGEKFVVKNQFKRYHNRNKDGNGDDSDEEEEKKEQGTNLINQIKEIAFSAIDISVAVSNLYTDPNNYEQNCIKQFIEDVNDLPKYLSRLKFIKKKRERGRSERGRGGSERGRGGSERGRGGSERGRGGSERGRGGSERGRGGSERNRIRDLISPGFGHFFDF